jgi:hypothetical protein
MAGLTLESALFAAIALVLIALLSVGFASRPAGAVPLLLPVEMAASSIESGATVSLRAVGFCEPHLLRRPANPALHRGNGAAARLSVGCRRPHRVDQPPLLARDMVSLLSNRTPWATPSSSGHSISMGRCCFSRIADQYTDLLGHHLTPCLLMRGGRVL